MLKVKSLRHSRMMVVSRKRSGSELPSLSSSRHHHLSLLFIAAVSCGILVNVILKCMSALYRLDSGVVRKSAGEMDRVGGGPSAESRPSRQVACGRTAWGIRTACSVSDCLPFLLGRRAGLRGIGGRALIGLLVEKLFEPLCG